MKKTWIPATKSVVATIASCSSLERPEAACDPARETITPPSATPAEHERQRRRAGRARVGSARASRSNSGSRLAHDEDARRRGRRAPRPTTCTPTITSAEPAISVWTYHDRPKRLRCAKHRQLHERAERHVSTQPGHDEERVRAVTEHQAQVPPPVAERARASTRRRAGAAPSAARGRRGSPCAARITISEANSIPVERRSSSRQRVAAQGAQAAVGVADGRRVHEVQEAGEDRVADRG